MQALIEERCKAEQERASLLGTSAQLNRGARRSLKARISRKACVISKALVEHPLCAGLIEPLFSVSDQGVLRGLLITPFIIPFMRLFISSLKLS